MDEKIYAMWLSDALGAGSAYGKILFEKHGSFKTIYGLSESDYAEAGVGLGTQVMKKLLNKSTAAQEKNYSFCNHNYFGIIEYSADIYPKRLKCIQNPPMVLYARGRMVNLDDNVCIGVVGTRSYTDSGWNAVYKISAGLARCGAIVVTGLASGIDTAATRASLDMSGYGVGVIGSGIERIYPSENTKLFEEMYKCGLVISELPPFSEIRGNYFPVRNRIISGLCQGVLVGEGEMRSGAMITAGHAAQQGRHIYAIPGDINSSESSGVNKLIREGATPVFSAWDVLSKYEYLYPHRIKKMSGEDDIEIPENRSTKKVRVMKNNPALAKKNENIPKKDSAPKAPKTEIKAEITKAESTPKLSDKEVEEKLSQMCEHERKLYAALDFEAPRSVDELSYITKIPASDLLGAMTFLEIDGLASHSGAGFIKK